MRNDFDFNNYPTNEEVADNVKTTIKTLREEHGLKQSDFSRMMGKSRSTIQGWERMQNDMGPIIKPDYRDLLILCDYFEISLDALFGRKPHLPNTAAGFRITRGNLHMVNKRPIQFMDDEQLIWGIVDQKNKRIVTLKGDVDFDRLPADFEGMLIPNDVLDEDELFDKPLTYKELQGYVDEENPIQVWVHILLKNAKGLEGYYTLTATGVQNDLGITWDGKAYGESWVAYAEKPVFLDRK